SARHPPRRSLRSSGQAPTAATALCAPPLAMNIHHLELFYYVARHGGVSAAARRIPYGIQQPAISAQIIQLEDHLGTTLFHRPPFQLTKAGEELFRFIEPFFGGIEEMGRKLRGG